MTQLRPDNSHEWDPTLFARVDETSDEFFYQLPRKVVHIDEGAIAAVTQLYRELLPAGGVILDLMSSWRSHLPPEVHFSQVIGLGMNGVEMADNPQLTDFVVQNLNETTTLPWTEQSFDAAICCVSVQYMQQPVALFREVRRVLKPGATFILTFSNRCFPAKAINLWRYTDDETHSQIVTLYFAAANGWEKITQRDCSPSPHQGAATDPLYAVWAYRASELAPF